MTAHWPSLPGSGKRFRYRNPSFYNGLLLLLHPDGTLRSSVSFGTYYDEDWLRIAAVPGGGWVVSSKTYFINHEWDGMLFHFDADGDC